MRPGEVRAWAAEQRRRVGDTAAVIAPSLLLCQALSMTCDSFHRRLEVCTDAEGRSATRAQYRSPRTNPIHILFSEVARLSSSLHVRMLATWRVVPRCCDRLEVGDGLQNLLPTSRAHGSSRPPRVVDLTPYEPPSLPFPHTPQTSNLKSHTSYLIPHTAYLLSISNVV